MGSLSMKGGIMTSSSMGAATSDVGGIIAKSLWKKFKNETCSALYSPFVICLGSGSLDPQIFLRCVSQDVFFLQAYAQAYELAEEYADDDDDKVAIVKLRKRVLKRLRNQDKLISEWGFEPPKESTCDNATLKYTEFLLETAAGKVLGEKSSVKMLTPFEKTKLAAYTLSAISPCMRLYTYISKEILSLLDPEDTDHIYKKWLNSLSSEKFEESASRIEELLDKLSISLTGEELDVVDRIYHRAMALELEFIWAQPVIQRTLVPFSRLHNKAEDSLAIFCDFDLTCTTIDSSALLAELAIVASTKGSEAQPSETTTSNIRTKWAGLFSQYMEEYKQCIESIIPDEANVGKSLQATELDYEGLSKALAQISTVEKMANSRMIDSNVLKGLNLDDIRRAAEHLSFQDGFKKFLNDFVEIKNRSTDIHVLSYCWCSDLIKFAISSGDRDFLNIHSNDLVYQDSISTGKMITKVESPMDKLQALNAIINRDKVKPLTVYIGGSVGDLLCLLQADIGIVIGSSTSLTRLGNHFGVSFVPLFPGLVTKQRELAKSGGLNRVGPSSVLYTVSSWNEVYASVLGQ